MKKMRDRAGMQEKMVVWDQFASSGRSSPTYLKL